MTQIIQKLKFQAHLVPGKKVSTHMCDLKFKIAISSKDARL